LSGVRGARVRAFGYSHLPGFCDREPESGQRDQSAGQVVPGSRPMSFLEADQPGMSLSKVIQMTIGDGLMDLWYEITLSNRSFKAEQLISLRAGTIDSDTYQMSIRIVDSECINEVSVEHFTLWKSGVEFIDRCDFPHVIRAMEPDYSLKYTYSELAAFLMPEFRKRLLGP
jgi:hypothetical protein